jgi:hypothetical protein
VPRGGCFSASKSRLVIANLPDDRIDKWIWTWRASPGQLVPRAALGDPRTATSYTMCLYANGTHAAARLPAGPSWRGGALTGFRMTRLDRVPDGLFRAVVRSGPPGMAKAILKGKGVNLPDNLVPPVNGPVVVQLVAGSSPTCFTAEYDSVATTSGSVARCTLR